VQGGGGGGDPNRRGLNKSIQSNGMYVWTRTLSRFHLERCCSGRANCGTNPPRCGCLHAAARFHLHQQLLRCAHVNAAGCSASQLLTDQAVHHDIRNITASCAHTVPGTTTVSSSQTGPGAPMWQVDGAIRTTVRRPKSEIIIPRESAAIQHHDTRVPERRRRPGRRHTHQRVLLSRCVQNASWLPGLGSHLRR
jgi:hypothetical protein